MAVAIVDLPPAGGEFQVNSYTDNMQRDPSVTALSDGGFVVTWSSFGQDGSEGGIYGQRYDSSGKKAGEEFLINSTRFGSQTDPTVAALPEGGFVVIWPSQEGDASDIEVYGQRYDSSGAKSGEEFLVTRYDYETQGSPSVAALSDGGFVVTWWGAPQLIDAEVLPKGAVYAQRYNSSGEVSAPAFMVSSTAGDQDSVAITGLSDGGFVVTWFAAGADPYQGEVYGQRYDSSGAKSGEEFLINSYTDGKQDLPAVTALSDGGFIVTWASVDRSDVEVREMVDGIYGQRYDYNGVKSGAEFLISPSSGSSLPNSAVTALTDGGFVIVWEADGLDGSEFGVYGQRYNSDGVKVGMEFLINSHTEGMQDLPAVTALADGGFVVVWESEGQDGSSWGIYGQRYNADGTPYVDEDDPAAITGTDGDDTLRGTVDDDIIKGLAGNDVLSGHDGDDTLTGGAGDDMLRGNAGADLLDGDAGNDLLYGGDGDDTVNGGADNDSLYGGNGADLLAGDDGDDFLFGGKGNDSLDGGDGNDDLYGGTGNDMVNGGSGNDIVQGGRGNDSLTGGADNDSLYGGSGSDNLDGGSGMDFLDGGDGADFLSGGADNDTVMGGMDNDIIHGNEGDDLLLGQQGDDNLHGDDGNDLLIGGAGDDTLIGDSGMDKLFGKEGNDLFVLNGDSGDIDTIFDFTSGEDHLQLSGEIFAGLAEGELGEDLFAANATGSAMDADDRVLYNTDTGALFYDADGNGEGAAVQLAILANKEEVQATDFLVA